MSDEKIKLLMRLFRANDLEELEARCPLNIHNWLYNGMDNEEFIDMVIMIDEIDDERIYKELKDRGEI